MPSMKMEIRPRLLQGQPTGKQPKYLGSLIYVHISDEEDSVLSWLLTCSGQLIQPIIRDTHYEGTAKLLMSFCY